MSVNERTFRERTLKITYAAKVKRIVDYLKENNDIREIDEFDQTILNSLKRDDIVEILLMCVSLKCNNW